MRLKSIISKNLAIALGAIIVCTMLGGCIMLLRSNRNLQHTPTEIEANMKKVFMLAKI